MHPHRTLPRGVVLALASTLLLAGCGGSARDRAPLTAPASGPRSGAPGAAGSLLGTLTGTVTGTLSLVTGVQWRTPVAQDVTISQVIGPAGGTMGFPGGLTLTVPANAVSAPTTFTITMKAGRLVAFDFAPQGAVFAQRLTVALPVALTNYSIVSGLLARGAYYPNDGLLDEVLGTARVSEFEPTTVTPDGHIIWTVGHFSGYMISVG